MQHLFIFNGCVSLLTFIPNLFSAAEYCKKLKAERLQMQKEAAILKREIESLNTAISAVQAQLPETGVPMTRQRKDQMREMFDDYVCQRTKENWKFWIVSFPCKCIFIGIRLCL